MKKKIAIIMTVILFISSVTVTYANTLIEQIPNYIQEIIEVRFEDKEIMEIKELLDLNDNVVGTLLLFSPSGYIAYNDNDIYEMSTESCFSIDLNDDIYYFGPLQMYQKENNYYVNLLSGDLYTENEMISINESFYETISTATYAIDTVDINEGIAPCAYTEGSLPYNTRPYTYNPDNRCGSLALAITLMYYDDHKYNYVVADSYTDTTGEALVKLLCPHIEELDSSYSGSTAGDVANGANWYLKYRGATAQYSSYIKYDITYSEYCSKIDLGKPVITLITNNPTYGNHWVVGIGYYNQYTGNSSRQLIVVNDGWGTIGREINFSYVLNAVYLSM